ncbi:CDC42 small effector protein 2 [Patagioenas fasciata monilis]|uniref:CDC42 small effector protein 2 n=1 Tax=Patagioenas fasciata monilis TaxID=372326 RepID=A0A1V4J5U3_PATFA|nr:CDC42 small effector protein 2 [Patagioenas fasciata monilis]
MSEFWLCFNCCIAEQPQPKRRRRIDRSMIGEPTNFVHTAHVGSGDLFSGMNSVSSIQNQMQIAFGKPFQFVEDLLFCSDDAIYQIGPTVPFGGMHTLASTRWSDGCSCRSTSLKHSEFCFQTYLLKLDDIRMVLLL